MHILIIRFSSMGDIVIQTPLINWLKSKLTNLKITFLTSKEFQALVEKNEQIDSVIYYERKKGREDFDQHRNANRALYTIHKLQYQRPLLKGHAFASAISRSHPYRIRPGKHPYESKHLISKKH